jgi:hypothetical protein
MCFNVNMSSRDTAAEQLAYRLLEVAMILQYTVMTAVQACQNTVDTVVSMPSQTCASRGLCIVIY